MSKIWVTRPGAIGQALCRRLEAIGHQPFLASPIEIIPISLTADQRAILQKGDFVVFVSPNAVEYYPANISQQGKIAAIGEATAQALQACHFSVDIIPQWFSTEGLLQTESFQSIQDKTIVIAKGQGGRQALVHNLRHRGAIVYEIPLYKREPKQHCFSQAYYLGSDWLVVTSQSILKNLWRLTPTDQQPLLQKIPLLVSSQRLVDTAHQLGFQTIKQSQGAHRLAIVEFFKYYE